MTKLFASVLDLSNAYPPFMIVLGAIIVVTLAIWALWTVVLKDHVMPRIDAYIVRQQRIRRRKKYLQEMTNSTYGGLEATLEMFAQSGPRHLKMREPGKRIPRHSALV